MKKNLISDAQPKETHLFRLTQILFLLLFSIELFASSYEWRVSANRERAYTNEAIYLEFVCEFSDEAELYAVEFDPQKSDKEMTIESISQTSRIIDGKKFFEYQFVAFAHKPGAKLLAFDALMKKTTRDSIRDTIIGRDNEKYAQYQTQRVALQKIALEIEASPLELVGEFSMEIKSDSSEIKALTPYHLEVRIEGVGGFDRLEPLAFEIEGVEIFTEEPKRELILTPEGYRGSWRQKFAFVSERDFRVEPFRIEYFSPKSQSKKVLRFEGVDVRLIEGYDKEILLDRESHKEPIFKIEYLYYLLAFIAGYLFSKIRFKRAETKRADEWCKKIKKASSIKELSFLLALEGGQRYSEILECIEKKELTNLAKAKRIICA